MNSVNFDVLNFDAQRAAAASDVRCQVCGVGCPGTVRLQSFTGHVSKP